jgi:hypothetical protein
MVGYYRTGVDVTFEYYPDDSLLEIDPRIGLIHRAKWINTGGPNPVNWGLTSYEEMMVMGFQYIEGAELTPLAVNTVKEDIALKVFPNPASRALSLNYVLEQTSDIKVEFTNVLGETVYTLEQKNKAAGNYLEEVDLAHHLTPGMYLLTFRTKNAVTTRRVVIE